MLAVCVKGNLKPSEKGARQLGLVKGPARTSKARFGRSRGERHPGPPDERNHCVLPELAGSQKDFGNGPKDPQTNQVGAPVGIHC